MNRKAVIFDMDGVLVDVSRSYRMAIKKTAESFLKHDISLELIQDYKNRGGLNNDWDLTERILLDSGVRIPKEEIIKKFQQFYLGDNFNGFIKEEKWLLSKIVSNWICQNYNVGIFTGRPRSEALYTITENGYAKEFQVVITMEDTPPGQGKPDPLGIHLALRKLETKRGWYIGDTIDDMIVANRAGLIPIGVVNKNPEANYKHQEELLRKNGAAYVINDVNQLPNVLRN